MRRVTLRARITQSWPNAMPARLDPDSGVYTTPGMTGEGQVAAAGRGAVRAAIRRADELLRAGHLTTVAHSPSSGVRAQL